MDNDVYVGTALVRPYSRDSLQVTIPADIGQRLNLEPGHRLWVRLVPSGFALQVDGPWEQVNKPGGGEK